MKNSNFKNPFGYLISNVPPLFLSAATVSFAQESDDTVYFLRLSLFDTSTRGEGCSCLSCHITDVLIWIPPIQHPVTLHVKKLPVHHKHPAFYVPRLRGERKERNQTPLKYKLTALRRLTLHQRRDVPDTHMNFHNKVTPRL